MWVWIPLRAVCVRGALAVQPEPPARQASAGLEVARREENAPSATNASRDGGPWTAEARILADWPLGVDTSDSWIIPELATADLQYDETWTRSPFAIGRGVLPRATRLR